MRDYNQSILEAEQRGMTEGRETEKEAVAKRLIALELPIDIVAKGSGISFEEVESLKKQKKDKSVVNN